MISYYENKLRYHIIILQSDSIASHRQPCRDQIFCSHFIAFPIVQRRSDIEIKGDVLRRLRVVPSVKVYHVSDTGATSVNDPVVAVERR